MDSEIDPELRELLESDFPETPGVPNDVAVKETLWSYGKIETMFDRVRLPDEITPPAPVARLKLPGYDEIEMLGRGGFGDVFLAEDEVLGRRVAIKRLRSDTWLGSGSNERPLQEARLASQLRHPGIVTLFEIVEHEGACHLVTEYVEGGTLDHLLESAPLSQQQAVEIAAALADALSHAHQRNVVHRDLKPANILLDASCAPHIADFGLAIRDDEQGHQLESAAGTIDFMSPEQMPGSDTYLDGRADIWSLGVILYRMLTGQMPFHGESRAELFREIQQRDPKPPRQVDPEIPAELEVICLKCLAKSPGDRYSSAAELATELRRCAANDRGAVRGWYAFGLLAGACLISFLVWAVAPLVAPSIEKGPNPGEDKTVPFALAPAHAVDTSAGTDLQVTRLRLRHYEFSESGSAHDRGILGVTTDAAHLNDDVRIEFGFSAPSYFYLLELTSQGEVACLIDSSNPDEGPQLRCVFPPNETDTYSLTDGLGLHAFAVVAATRPLPQYESWQSSLGKILWRHEVSQGVWRYTHDRIGRGHYIKQRGVLRQQEDAPVVLRELCEQLKSASGVEAIRVIAFPVTSPESN